MFSAVHPTTDIAKFTSACPVRHKSGSDELYSIISSEPPTNSVEAAVPPIDIGLAGDLHPA
jgi:hypothetical protein